jgi:hypothetical protein
MKPHDDRQQKKLADDQRLLCAWRKHHRDERDEVLRGPHEPISDPLSDEPETPFRTIKAIALTSSPHERAPPEAKLGTSNSHTSTQRT